MPNVFLVDGQAVSETESGCSPLASGAMFAYGAIDRLRGYLGPDGRMRVVGLVPHLRRTIATVRRLFGEIPALTAIIVNWRQWIADAIKLSNFDAPYIHLGYGQYRSTGTMLQSVGSIAQQTIVFVTDAPPLYGDRLSVVSEFGCARPRGPLTGHKTHGYTELLFLKEEARRRCTDKDPKSVETLLFDYDSLQFGSNKWDAQVSEFGCSNAGAIDSHALYLSKTPRFEGVTEQIVEMLAQKHMGLRIERGLCRRQLRQGGFAMGTAGGIVPVVWMDNEKTEPHSNIDHLARWYKKLYRGELPESEEWAPVIF